MAASRYLGRCNILYSPPKYGKYFSILHTAASTVAKPPIYYQTNTFQGMLITDSANSYAVFTYYCGDLNYPTFMHYYPPSAIGFSTEDGLHAVHEATFRSNIACLNHPTSPWVNIVYELTDNGKMTLLTMQPEN